MDRRTTKTTHYSLVALICVLIVTFALGMGGVATAGQDVAKTDAVSGFSKVGNFDLETLRQQYFSQTAVQETTASYSGKRWVIVELEGDSLFTSYENRGYWYGDFTTYCNSEEGKLLKADIEASHKDFLAVLDNNRIDYKYKYSYSTLNNGVALKVDADTFNEIKKLDGVKSVYYSESYAIPTVAVSNNANVYTTGIYDSSNLAYKGEGMVVAVLDTGLDYSHEAFATMPSNPAWTKEYVAAKMAASTRFNAQATVDEVYYNSKVPFAYDSSAAVTSDIVVNAKFGNINKTLIGTWKGGTLDRSSYTYIHYVLVIGADSIKADLGDGTLVDASNIVWNEDYQTYDFNLAGDTLYSFGEYHGAYSFASADYSVYTNLSKLETGVVSADETALVGTFETKGGVTIGINSTFVTINGVDATEFEYSERDAKYTFYIDDASASIEYDSTEGQWFYVVGGEKDQLVIASMAPAAIPEAYFGVWSNATIGDYSVTTITITADGVFDGGYKIGKVASADATSMTVKSPYGDYIFTLGDGTLTMNNGYSDIVLDKNVKVVFIAGEGYQAAIFYVAKVGADGKIDMDSFALEDPTMAAGYTFKGWFGQDDSTIEFDEDATFTQNTIFVSKIEKTGYVLTFKKSASDSEPVVVVVDKATGKLTADQIPADLTYEDGSVFTGWYTTAGVKAVADLTITQDTTFIAKSVKESDYEGYWINTTSGKEALAIIADGKVTFGYGVSGVDYTFNAEDGSLKFTATISYMKHTYVVTKTANGISISDSYYDRSAEQDVSNVYELTAPKSNSLAKSCAGTYQCSNSEIIAVLENGIVTKYDGNATTYGYISGTISNVKIVYKTGSSSSVTTKTGKYDAKSLVLGGKIYVKNPSAFASYYNSNNGTFYVYTREGKATLYTYKGTSYATIDGELAIGNVVTVSYTDADGKAQSFVAKITGKTAYDVAGAERGTFTAEGKDSITFDGFDSATIGEKAYSYIINKKNVVVLKSDSETIGVTLDSEAKTYAIVTGDGFARSYADANSEYYTVEFDGFGGVNVIYKSKSSTTVYAGTYTPAPAP